MATTKVSALSALTTPDGAEELLINDGGTSKKITIANAIIAGTGITKSGATISAAPVALTTIQTAANQSAQLALTTQEGDVVVRSDESKTYMHNGGSAGDMNDFTLMATPTDAVTSVNSVTGAVTAAHIATAVEAASDSNTFTDADHSKLNAIEASATADQTNAEIRTAVEAATDSNVFTDADHTKLNAIEASATADQSAGEILTLLEDGIDSVHYKDGSIDNAHIADDAVGEEHLATGAVVTAAINDDAVTQAKMADDAIGEAQLAASAVVTAAINDDAVTAAKLANSINTDIATGVTANTTANAALPKAGGTMTGAVVGATDTDTSNSGTVDLDFTADTNFVLTLTGNITSLTASNEVVGQSGFIVFIQDGTGSRTVALHGDYETAGGVGLTLTSTASATDIVPYVVAASSRILLGTPQLAFS